MSKLYTKIEDVSITVKNTPVITNLSADFAAAQIHGIFGGIGSGKTILLKCISGINPISHGKIIVNGTVMRKGAMFPDRLGVCFEAHGFVPKLTGYENLKLLESLRGKPDTDEIYQVLEAVGLAAKMEWPVSSYSQGMRQKLGIAQAIIGPPKCLLLDEPFNFLDEEAIQNTKALLHELKQKGVTIFVASSRKKLLFDLCDSVYSIESGEMIVTNKSVL